MEAAQQQAASNKALDCSVHSKVPKVDLPKSKRTRKAVQTKGQRKRKAAKKQTRRRENEDTSPKIAVNSAPASEKDGVTAGVQLHTDPELASRTQTQRIQPHTDPQGATRIQPHTEVPTSGYAGQISHSCNLDPVSMEMTCETTVDKASMQPHPIWSRTCNEVSGIVDWMISRL